MDASNYRMVVTSGYDYVSTGSIADGQLRRWLRDVEQLDLDDLPPGVRLDTDSAADLHGAYTRWRLRESGPDGIRQLTLVVRARSGDAGPWVRLEVEHLPAVAGGQPARSGAPELAAALLTEVRATDGPVAVTARPVVLSEADLPRLLDELRDRRRRLPVVLLAVPPALAEPLAGELAGLAVGYLLNPEVAAAVNQVLVNHRVPPGGARCYLPGVEPEQAVDGFRHPAIPAFPGSARATNWPVRPGCWPGCRAGSRSGPRCPPSWRPCPRCAPGRAPRPTRAAPSWSTCARTTPC